MRANIPPVRKIQMLRNHSQLCFTGICTKNEMNLYCMHLHSRQQGNFPKTSNYMYTLKAV